MENLEFKIRLELWWRKCRNFKWEDWICLAGDFTDNTVVLVPSYGYKF